MYTDPVPDIACELGCGGSGAVSDFVVASTGRVECGAWQPVAVINEPGTGPACSKVMRVRGEGPPSSSSASGAPRVRTMPSWSSAVRGAAFCCSW